jgi:Tfp pilus assembly protein PilO
MKAPKDRVALLLTIAGLAAAFLAGFELPSRSADAALKTEIAAAKAEIARGPQVLAEFKAAQTQFESCRTYLDDSAESVAPADPHALLGRISRLARQGGLTVVRMEPETPRPRESYTEHPFRLDFHGDLAALGEFLHGLETGPRLFAVDDLTIREPSAAEDQANLEGSLRFSVFVVRTDSAGFSEKADPVAGS